MRFKEPATIRATRVAGFLYPEQGVSTVDKDSLHIIGVGLLVYAALIVLLRLSGKRTLSKWNSFDFVVTVAFGSTLATTLLDETVSFQQGIIAFGLLIGMQFLITYISVRCELCEKLIKSKPTLLLYKGRFIESKLRRQRITRSEVLAAVRNNGLLSLDSVEAVVLETDGSLSVIKTQTTQPAPSALEGIDTSGLV